MDKPLVFLTVVLLILSVVEISWLFWPSSHPSKPTGRVATWNSSLPTKSIIRLYFNDHDEIEAVGFENTFMQAGLYSDWSIKQFTREVAHLFKPFGLATQCQYRSLNSTNICPTTVKWIGVASLCYESRKFEDQSFSGIQLFQGGRLHCPELYDFYLFLKRNTQL
jgi:hypothetical protein